MEKVGDFAMYFGGKIQPACLRIEISGGQGVGKRTMKNDFSLA